MVALVKLEGMEKRKPDQLSGGQKQRVALARSLARRPQVLLLDEPLAALDKKLRESTQLELMELQRRLGMTFIIVTHDQEEAMTMANRIGVMDAGRLEQVATPRELYEAPRSRWVAEFVGDVNLFEGEVSFARARSPDDCDPRRRNDRRRRAAPAGDQGDASASRSGPRRSSCRAAVRHRTRSHSQAINRLEGVVTDVSYLGGLTIYKVKLDFGAVVRSSMANTARLDIDAYSAEPARGGVVHARRLRGAGAMSARRIFARPARFAAIAPYVWMVLFFLVPFGFVLKISLSQTAIAQPPYLPVFDFAEGWAAIKAAFARACRWTISGCWSPTISTSLSYLRSLVVAVTSTSILLLIGYPIAYGMARLPRRWQGDRDDAGDRAVLDLVPDPHLCLDQHPAA